MQGGGVSGGGVLSPKSALTAQGSPRHSKAPCFVKWYIIDPFE